MCLQYPAQRRSEPRFGKTNIIHTQMRVREKNFLHTKIPASPEINLNRAETDANCKLPRSWPFLYSISNVIKNIPTRDDFFTFEQISVFEIGPTDACEMSLNLRFDSSMRKEKLKRSRLDRVAQFRF